MSMKAYWLNTLFITIVSYHLSVRINIERQHIVYNGQRPPNHGEQRLVIRNVHSQLMLSVTS